MMNIKRVQRGIYTQEEISFIQKNTSFEYIEEIEAVDTKPGVNMYRVVLTDTYSEQVKNIKGGR